MLELNKIYQGDCLKVMKDIDDNSIDSIITDPPYGLSFMGKKWDYNVPSIEVFEEMLRVTKPGGTALIFAGSRTQHRMACNIEDAGWILKDCIMWMYGSGFPKSLNIGKAVDKANGRKWEDRIELNTYIKECRVSAGISRKDLNALFKYKDGVEHWERVDKHGANVIRKFDYIKLKPLIGMDNRFDSFVDRIEAEREVIGKHNTDMGGLGGERLGEKGGDITIASTDQAKQYEGWGTALKPALEPITVARKPLSEKTVAQNVLKWGTGGINIDGCRVELNGDKKTSGGCKGNTDPVNINLTVNPKENNSIGRFPANLIHDGSEEVEAVFPDTKSGKDKTDTPTSSNSGFTGHGMRGPHCNHGDSGSASRFFYCAKTSKKERNAGCDNLSNKQTWASQDKRENNSFDVFESDGRPKTLNKNNHPTVKPIALMRYLCRLITPKNGIILDPFMGSGTTGIAAELEGFDFVGIELEEESFEIAKLRINNASQKGE